MRPTELVGERGRHQGCPWEDRHRQPRRRPSGWGGSSGWGAGGCISLEMSSSPAQRVSLAPSTVWRGRGRSFRCPEKAQNEGAHGCPHGPCPGQSVWTPFCFHDLTGSRRLGRLLRVHGDAPATVRFSGTPPGGELLGGTLGPGTRRRWASGPPAHTHQQSPIQHRSRWSFWETRSLEDLSPGCT